MWTKNENGMEIFEYNHPFNTHLIEYVINDSNCNCETLYNLLIEE
jgi:hypothetical protein